MSYSRFAAADLGATSGRVIVGTLADGRFALEEVNRFPTPGLEIDGHLHWDAEKVREYIRDGLRRATATEPLDGVGVDTWGVDHARLRADGTLSEPPYSYRDNRTNGVPEAFFEAFPAEKLYGQCGLQVMEFNTVFQYAAAATDPGWAEVAWSLLLPDLFTYWLTGAHQAELTHASTSGLLDVSARAWSRVTLDHLRDHYGLDLYHRLPGIVTPGTVVGPVTDPAAAGTPMVAVGSHDTASAIVAVPAASRRFAYISSGTWSLVGLELDHPILTEASRAANFTNELGVDGTVRYLRNVMGLWVLTQCQATWGADAPDLPALLDDAASRTPLRTVVDMEDARLIPPGDMPARLADMARETGQPVPTTPAEYTRCILDSLALDYRRIIQSACDLAGTTVDVIHVVGGGCRNRLLNQLTAEATGLTVIAGPAEGTALGNMLVQARAVGALAGDLTDLRKVARASSRLEQYTPGALGLTPHQWDSAAQRIWTT